MSGRTREQVVGFIRNQFSDLDDPRISFDEEKNYRYHYGLFELRALMDFIYGGEPKAEEELLVKISFVERERRWRGEDD